jgi:hypothetical protein
VIDPRALAGKRFRGDVGELDEFALHTGVARLAEICASRSIDAAFESVAAGHHDAALLHRRYDLMLQALLGE